MKNNVYYYGDQSLFPLLQHSLEAGGLTVEPFPGHWNMKNLLIYGLGQPLEDFQLSKFSFPPNLVLLTKSSKGKENAPHPQLFVYKEKRIAEYSLPLTRFILGQIAALEKSEPLDHNHVLKVFCPEQARLLGPLKALFAPGAGLQWSIEPLSALTHFARNKPCLLILENRPKQLGWFYRNLTKATGIMVLCLGFSKAQKKELKNLSSLIPMFFAATPSKFLIRRLSKRMLKKSSFTKRGDEFFI